jgi:hypothetical protein
LPTTHRQGTVSRSDADAAVWIAQRCSAAVVAKDAIACQSSVFCRHLNEATKLGAQPALPKAKERYEQQEGGARASGAGAASSRSAIRRMTVVMSMSRHRR